MSVVAAPSFVPLIPGSSKHYESPPRRAGSWGADRPGDLAHLPSTGYGLGQPGPGQGYALKLVKAYQEEVRLTSGERWEDAAAGAVVVALKRASLFGRAPVKADLEIAFRIWGFLDDAPADLLKVRQDAFSHIDNSHNYTEARRLADSVYANALCQSAEEVAAAHTSDWRSLIDVERLSSSVASDGLFDD